jgi:hypothetical protein
MELPADPGGHLLGLRPGQQVAEVEGVQELLVGQPAPLVDDLAVHQGDLAGRAAKAQTADPGESP